MLSNNAKSAKIILDLTSYREY